MKFDNQALDIITDVEDDMKVDENGITRSTITGQFIKGTSNPKYAVQKVKVKRLQELIVNKTGPDCEKLINKLLDIALYDYESPIWVKDAKTGEMVEKQRRYHYINITTQMQALTLLMAYYYGRPTEKTEVDTNINVNIEKKVADITQLINRNEERLKLVN